MWRRLSEAPELFGQSLDISPWLWLPVGWLVLLGAFFLVFFFYVREVRTVGWLWASFLASLRTATILSIFLLWLLPATRTVEWTEQRSRVLDEPFRLMMDKETPVEKRAIFEWGGWLRSSYWMLDENVDRMQGGNVDNDSHGLRP